MDEMSRWLERVFIVIDLLCLVGSVEHYSHHIKTDIPTIVHVLLVRIGCCHNTLLLEIIYGFFRGASEQGCTRLDFHENDLLFVRRDDIHLQMSHMPVGLQNLQSLLLKQLHSQLLSALSYLIMLSHMVINFLKIFRLQRYEKIRTYASLSQKNSAFILFFFWVFNAIIQCQLFLQFRFELFSQGLRLQDLQFRTIGAELLNKIQSRSYEPLENAWLNLLL